MDRERAHRGWRGFGRHTPVEPLLLPLQPLLAHIARGVARSHPSIFARLGRHCTSRFIVDPIGLPILLYLRPDPARPMLRAMRRSRHVDHDARIAAPLPVLLRMVDADVDGDAMFFSRDLEISGDTEAVVSLRNAIDSMDCRLTVAVAAMFGPPGKLGLALLRRYARGRGA